LSGTRISSARPARRIADDNIEFRTFPDFAQLYQPFDGLMFFGDNGGADQFALRPDEPEAGVFVWGHDEERSLGGPGSAQGVVHAGGAQDHEDSGGHEQRDVNPAQ
jgi:hypothetical protein